MAIFFAILMFSFLIFIHEFGHFITAKLCGVQVNEFSMFMGPAIFKKQIGETLYSLRLIPFGGYCAMEGEDSDSDNPRSFGAAAWWKRLIILVAGAAMNFIIGVVLVFIVLLPAQQISVPQIVKLEPDSYLAESGIRKDDVILKIDDEPLYLLSDFSAVMMVKGDGVYDVVVERGGEKLLLENVNMSRREFPNEDGTTSVRYGVDIGGGKSLDFWQKLQYTGYISLDYVRSVKLSLQMLVTGKAGVQDLGGPVMIVQQTAQIAEQSADPMSAFFNMLNFGAMIAVNLAVMNLLPIPALDGGRVVCLLITTGVEKIFKRKLDPKYEAFLHGAGMILLLGFMALITFKDIFSLVKGWFA